MPSLIPISIREYNGFIVRRRHYLTKRSIEVVRRAVFSSQG
jgi:hypothetical protein